MKAKEIKIETFLAKNKTQFIIPIYQRHYNWETTQCEQLLDDILEVGTNDTMKAHFVGNIVYVCEVSPALAINKLIIIDGQQRLTTVTLIYLALYRLAITMEDKKLEAEYLSNRFSSEEELKLCPTQKNDDEAIKHLKRSHAGEKFNEPSKVIENFNYLNNRITKENFKDVLEGLSKLMVVEVSLDEEGSDDPQKIFESLNSKGLPLSQADLIRNYILMSLNLKNQTKINDDYWEIIEQLAKDETSNESKVSDFIRDYLTFINEKIPKKNEVYSAFKAKFPTTTLEELEKNLSSIKSFAPCYNKLVNPKNEKDDKDIRLQLEYINRLGIDVARPFLMQVYKDYSDKIITKMIFIGVLELTQSFVCRRSIVGLPTNSFNQIFMKLAALIYKKIDKDDYLMLLQKWLLKRSGSQYFPKDKKVVDDLKIKDIYRMYIKTYLLERLEHFENNEPVTIEGNKDITIEHIFPQNPDPQWKEDLGADEYDDIKETYLHTIGNLTLSGNNGALSNKPFIHKRDLEGGYRDSHLWLNTYLGTLNQWNKEEIEKRSDLLAERFLKIWEYPAIELAENNEVNIFEAGDSIMRMVPESGQSFSTENDYIDFVNRNTEAGTAGVVYMRAIRQLEAEIGENIFNAYSLDELRILKNRLLRGGSLHEFNIRTDNRAPSAAIGKLIKFRRSCEFQTG